MRLLCRRTQVYGVNKVETKLVSFTEVLPLKGRRDSHKDKSDDGWGQVSTFWYASTIFQETVHSSFPL